MEHGPLFAAGEDWYLVDGGILGYGTRLSDREIIESMVLQVA